MKKHRERRRRKTERLRALADSAIRARRFAPGETLDMGFELIESARSLNRAAKRPSSSPEPKGRRYRRCPVCGKGELVPADDIVSEIDGYTFVEQGRRCTACGEEFIPEEESQRMIKVARRLGLWGEPLKLAASSREAGAGRSFASPRISNEAWASRGTKR